jgi:hypothetical protein
VKSSAESPNIFRVGPYVVQVDGITTVHAAMQKASSDKTILGLDSNSATSVEASI